MGALGPFFKSRAAICQMNGDLLRECRVVVLHDIQAKVIATVHLFHHSTCSSQEDDDPVACLMAEHRDWH